MLLLYTIGPWPLTVNPAAGDKLAYAIDYADTAITPNGLLATRRFDANVGTKCTGRGQKSPAGRPIAPRRQAAGALAGRAGRSAQPGRRAASLSPATRPAEVPR